MSEHTTRDSRRGCRMPRCPDAAVPGSPYCARHRKPAPVRSGARAGYDAAWARLRVAWHKQYPMCERCAVLGIETPATVAHHIIPITVDPTLRLDPSNLMSLCSACHRIVHAQTDGGRMGLTHGVATPVQHPAEPRASVTRLPRTSGAGR